MPPFGMVLSCPSSTVASSFKRSPKIEPIVAVEKLEPPPKGEENMALTLTLHLERHQACLVDINSQANDVHQGFISTLNKIEPKHTAHTGALLGWKPF